MYPVSVYVLLNRIKKNIYIYIYQIATRIIKSEHPKFLPGTLTPLCMHLNTFETYHISIIFFNLSNQDIDIRC